MTDTPPAEQAAALRDEAARLLARAANLQNIADGSTRFVDVSDKHAKAMRRSLERMGFEAYKRVAFVQADRAGVHTWDDWMDLEGESAAADPDKWGPLVAKRSIENLAERMAGMAHCFYPPVWSSVIGAMFAHIGTAKQAADDCFGDVNP